MNMGPNITSGHGIADLRKNTNVICHLQNPYIETMNFLYKITYPMPNQNKENKYIFVNKYDVSGS